MQRRALNRILGLKSHLRQSMFTQQAARASGATATAVTPKRAVTTATADPREIIVFTDPGTKTVELNRPKALNALNHNMVTTLLPQLKSWGDNPEVHAVVMHGAGDRAFCAGGDVVQLWKDGQDDATRQKCLEFFADEYRLNHALGTSSIPIVSYLNGITMGGGVGLSVHGRFRVATENTVFAMPEVGIGFFPDVGGSFFLPRLRDHYGFYLALTGASIKGSVIRDVGIATHFVTSAVTVEDLTRAVHSSFMPGAKYSPAERERIVGEVLDTLDEPGAAAAAEEPSPARQAEMKEISECFSKETVEEIVEAVAAMAANKAGEEGHWSHRAHKSLSRACPLAMKVTHKQLVEGGKLDLAECLKMELRMDYRFMQPRDKNSALDCGTFFEGVRAQLVDKDRKPQWHPAALGDVSKEMVDMFFEPMPEGVDELEL